MLRTQILKYSAVAVFVGLVGVGVASAQDPGGQDLGAPTGVTPSKQVNLSMKEQVNQGKVFLGNMETIRARVRKDLADARAKRDVVKTLCLNDKLNQLDVALRSATERQKALELAEARSDKDLTNHEFTILSVLHTRATEIDAAAKQCIGKEVGFVGESSVKSSVEPGMPEEDVTDLNEITISTPADCSSCFK